MKENLKIGNVELKNRVFLAPMAGYTDMAFRKLCGEMGCGLLYTEMINAKALCYEDQKTNSMIKIDDSEEKVALQIFGHEVEFIKGATEILNSHKNDILDINMGCPAPKVVKNNDGSALMTDPKLVGQIIKTMREASKKPITMKIRKGWDEDCVNAIEIAKIGEANGVDAIAVHGRTREQFYSGVADWDIIRDVKNAVSVPVIGNGDVFSLDDAIRMIDHTNCDAIMIGRGAQGNPFIFRDISHYLKNGERIDVASPQEKIDMAIRHLLLSVEEKGEYVAVREMRKHLAYYVKGIKNSARIKNMMFKTETVDGVVEILSDYREESLT